MKKLLGQKKKDHDIKFILKTDFIVKINSSAMTFSCD